MSRRKVSIGTALAVMAVLVFATTGAPANNDDDVRTYEVTITNETSGQPLTPPVVATHSGKNQVFEVGQPASVGVREIAENGNNAPLLAFLGADPFDRISESKQAGMGPLVPEGTPGGVEVPPSGPEFPDSVTFEITAEEGANRLSFVSMLICTNDGFTGVNGLRLPSRVGRTITAETAGYDAFTEVNDEDFAHIVPPCQGLIGVSSGEMGEGVSNPALAEGGVISHHQGIKGGSDLVPEVHGWDIDEEVAEISVTRLS
ncbi:MAG TPA: spondin domain-containing protein [Actinomycetota bacterium]|nr:spondin domain-containing protein [Actinomycetota bacterium]